MKKLDLQPHKITIWSVFNGKFILGGCDKEREQPDLPWNYREPGIFYLQCQQHKQNNFGLGI